MPGHRRAVLDCTTRWPGSTMRDRLAKLAERYDGELCIVMRTYFEKPRTTVGWKGLINDPHLDGSYRVNDGLIAARGFLLEVISLGLPVAANSSTPSPLNTWPMRSAGVPLGPYNPKPDPPPVGQRPLDARRIQEFP